MPLQDLHGRGLPRTVRTQESEHLPGSHPKRQAIDRLRLPVVLVQVMYLDGGHDATSPVQRGDFPQYTSGLLSAVEAKAPSALDASETPMDRQALYEMALGVGFRPRGRRYPIYLPALRSGGLELRGKLHAILRHPHRAGASTLAGPSATILQMEAPTHPS